jgi:hypothetical protein
MTDSERPSFATNILGKTFTVIQTIDVRPGDVLLDLQTSHIRHEELRTVKSIIKITDEFYDIVFKTVKGKKRRPTLLGVSPRYAHTCLFGRVQ